MRTPLITANWKMNTTPGEAEALARLLVEKFAGVTPSNIDLVVCPPVISLTTVAAVLPESGALLLGAQDVYPAPDGAFTGAINARMLASVGVRYCIIGHSERRLFFHEQDSDIAAKLIALSEAGITAILCVGESLEVREAGSNAAIEFVINQLRFSIGQALTDGFIPMKNNLVIAYEPIWSIGTGQTATPEIAQEMARAIRAEMSELLGEGAAEWLRVLYGGSVNSANVSGFAVEPDIDGCLVGGASLKADEFALLVERFQ